MKYKKVKDLKIGDVFYTVLSEGLGQTEVISIKKKDDISYLINDDWVGNLYSSYLKNKTYYAERHVDIRSAQTLLVKTMKENKRHLLNELSKSQENFSKFCDLLAEKIKEREVTIVEMSQQK